MTLGEQIKEAREKKNYSQEELAEVCGVSRQAVSKWENDISVPQGANRETLNEVLGVECPREEKTALKRGLFVWSRWITAAVLLVSIICVGFYVITRPDEGLPEADAKEETDPQPRVVSVRFYDSEQREVLDEALWYNAAYIESILIQWEGPAAPDSISIYYIPGGSDMIEYGKFLSTREIVDAGTAALLNPQVLKDEQISGYVTFTLNYGGFSVNSDQYNIFYDPALPPAEE